jgi:hypothetical protein
MQPTKKKLKTLRLRQETLKNLDTEKLLEVRAGLAADPWDTQLTAATCA